ncbi:MAG: ATP-grasp domain-containing protein [bacterium]
MVKNIILFVGNFPKEIDSVRAYMAETHRDFRLALLHRKYKVQNYPKGKLDIILTCDLNSPDDITKTLLPYQNELFVITCADEKSVQYLKKIISYVPYLNTPTSESLEWATNKITMREKLSIYDKTITPNYSIVCDTTKKTIKGIIEKVGFPLLIKPSGLASSMLVNLCYHEEELEQNLKMTFRKIRSLYKKVDGRGEPTVLVEQFMEGKMYSIDGYIDGNGEIYLCPLVRVKTGRSCGFDDFFGYERITPTLLQEETMQAAEETAKKAIYALGLRNTSAHIELMHTPQGWKVIELGPRIGGYRHKMYSLSYGINHAVNDILIRIPEKPIIPKKVNGYTATLMFFAKKEGKLLKLNGIKKIQELLSFVEIIINKKVGDMCRFAKNGGSFVVTVTLFNENRSKLLADIRRLEQTIVIETA